VLFEKINISVKASSHFKENVTGTEENKIMMMIGGEERTGHNS
jgi:hypothetical protein